MRNSTWFFMTLAVLAAIAAFTWDKATVERRRFVAEVEALRQDRHKQTAEIRQIVTVTAPDGRRIDAIVKSSKPVQRGDKVTIVERADPFGVVTFRVVDP